MGSTIREGGTQHWAGKALSLSNERWLKRARGAALKRDRSTCAFDQGRVNNGRSCLFHFQPMMFYLTADRGKQRILGARLNQRLAKSTMRGLVRHAAI
jgi:hypothetical protein